MGPKRVRTGEPEAAADLMPRILARLGGQGRVAEHRAFEAFELSVGAVLRARTEPERLRSTTLFVRVASSALAHELTLLRGEILARMAALIGPGIVTDLRTRVGKVGGREGAGATRR